MHVRPQGATEPAPRDGTTVHVQVRDVSLADAPARQVAAAEGVTAGAPDWSADVVVDVPDGLPTDGTVTVYARVAVHGTAATAPGDWVTMQSYPLTPSADVVVWVRRVA